MKKDILASRLTSRISFRNPVRTSDFAGGFTVSWVNIGTVWAEVLPYSPAQASKEIMENGKINNKKKYKITIRYKDNLTQSMSICYQDEMLNIRSLSDPTGRKEQLDIIAESGVAL